MNTVLIVCGAGASSTFLALRLRRIAMARGLDLVVEAGSLPDLDERMRETTVLLVGPHLGSRFDELDERARLVGARAAMLPDTVFGPEGADHAADLVIATLERKETDHG
ncbi:PTS sugar transporter subunit IIC [Herbiconiux sp. KACC 21604]|uniref:PTS sugar transporter subunit IIB n=1 Tax=unclassified Herbiconiux TaxID=2618217 RepID=UPI0014909FDD|nr:PTS sugar transporter subunit IIC [Herbiconiux sp. SALV-R1]QJU52417.1 PTS sugar transporter subunit IIC [Herbiconiux sp. SALV-R1]WPO87281.1 PTS sugar transporter subunit IIC [Herbiconiux sp. KACC 21604]